MPPTTLARGLASSQATLNRRGRHPGVAVWGLFCLGSAAYGLNALAAEILKGGRAIATWWCSRGNPFYVPRSHGAHRSPTPSARTSVGARGRAMSDCDRWLYCQRVVSVRVVGWITVADRSWRRPVMADPAPVPWGPPQRVLALFNSSARGGFPDIRVGIVRTSGSQFTGGLLVLAGSTALVGLMTLTLRRDRCSARTTANAAVGAGSGPRLKHEEPRRLEDHEVCLFLVSWSAS